jgi:RimJ/RimL family protein N-acetyltransferase
VIRLINVYEQEPGDVIRFLYRLLQERNPIASISHREMPTFEQHLGFVMRTPYKAWYVICADNRAGDARVGSVYLTNDNEIGIALLKDHQGCGHGVNAVRALMELHPSDRFLANIAPGNARSISMFENMGFDLIQLTLAKETK